MNAALASGKADLIEILPAVDAGRIAVAFNLEDVESPQFQFAVERGDRTSIICRHRIKLRKTNQMGAWLARHCQTASANGF
jgi:hypothetical protein